MDKLERVARAVCSGISGPTICRDVSDCSYCMNAAQAAIAALEPVSVQEAARVILGDDFTSPMLEALDPYNNDADVWADVKNALRALAEKDDTP